MAGQADTLFDRDPNIDGNAKGVRYLSGTWFDHRDPNIDGSHPVQSP